RRPYTLAGLLRHGRHPPVLECHIQEPGWQHVDHRIARAPYGDHLRRVPLAVGPSPGAEQQLRPSRYAPDDRFEYPAEWLLHRLSPRVARRTKSDTAADAHTKSDTAAAATGRAEGQVCL